MPTQKTWVELETELAETFRKWHCGPGSIVTPLAVQKGVAFRRAVARKGLPSEERLVTLIFYWRNPTTGENRPIKMTMINGETPTDNLELLAKAVEEMRLAEVRGIHRLMMKMYRQMYPETPKAAPSAQEKPRVRSSGPYAVLHIADDAPLEVAEAAYRALVKAAHPDYGGAHTAMVALNAAIEQIRAAKAKQAYSMS